MFHAGKCFIIDIDFINSRPNNKFSTFGNFLSQSCISTFELNSISVTQSSTSISTTALRPLSIYIVTPFWLLVLNNSFLSIFSLFLSLFLICFAFNMQDFIWEKRRSRFSRQLKEQNIFSYCRNCIFCYFSAFFSAPAKAHFHQRTFIYIQDAGFFAGKKRTGIFTCS